MGINVRAPSVRRPRAPWPRLVPLLLGVLVATGACAATVAPLPVVGDAAAAPGFEFARDTFAFANEIRARHPDANDLYANYCFVLARGLRQFHRFARFDPTAPKLDAAAYRERVRQVAARQPWEAPLPAAARVVIPGYPDLRAFSREEEAAVKAGLGGRFWTLVHWTNWRVVLPVSRGHQEGIAREILDELARGRLVQLLVTNFPEPELNHTLVAYASRATPQGIDFAVWDPNDPAAPGVVTFDRARRRFWATRVYDTVPGVIRVFRMAYSALL